MAEPASYEDVRPLCGGCGSEVEDVPYASASTRRCRPCQRVWSNSFDRRYSAWRDGHSIAVLPMREARRAPRWVAWLRRMGEWVMDRLARWGFT